MARRTSGKIRVIGYIRTSTGDKQEDSPAVQESKLRDSCERKGWELIGVRADYLKGKTALEKRPQLSRMLQERDALDYDGIVCIATDRAFRGYDLKSTIEDLATEYDIFVYGFDDTIRYGRVPGMATRQRAHEKMQSNMQAMVNQYYSDFVSDKVTDKQQYRVTKLQLHSGGAPPFGYSLHLDQEHPALEKHANIWGPDEDYYGDPSGPLGAKRGVDWLRWIFKRFLETESQQQIASELNTATVPPPRLVQWNRLTRVEQERRLEAQARRRDSGLKTMHLPPEPWWDPSVLSDILRSPTYLGQISYSPGYDQVKGKSKVRRWHPGLHPAIVDLETFDSVQLVLDKRAQRKSPGQRREVLLSGILRCSCGLGQMTRVGGHGAPYDFNYSCGYNRKTGGQACDNPRKNGTAVHKAAFRLLQMGLVAQRDKLLKHPPVPKAKDDSLNQALQAKLDQRKRVIDMAVNGSIDSEDVARLLPPIDAEIAEMKKVIVADGEPDTTVDEIDLLIENLEEGWVHMDFSVQRELLRSYVPYGFILDHGYLKAKVCGMPISIHVEPLTPYRGEGLPGHYSTHEAARLLGVTPQAIALKIKDGKLPVQRVQTGKLWKQYIPCEAIDALVR